MLNTETVLKLIDKGFTHDEIMAMENPKTEPQTQKEEPKTEPQTQKEEPKTEPQTEPQTQKEEPKQEVTGQQILEAILALGKQVQTGQLQGARLPELKDLTADDVVAQMIRPTGGENK